MCRAAARVVRKLPSRLVRRTRCQSARGVSTYGRSRQCRRWRTGCRPDEPLEGGAHRPFDIGFNGDVTDHRPRFDTLGAQRSHGRLVAGIVSRPDRHRGPGQPNTPGQRHTDAVISTGDHSCGVAQVLGNRWPWHRVAVVRLIGLARSHDVSLCNSRRNMWFTNSFRPSSIGPAFALSMAACDPRSSGKSSS